MPRSSGGRHRLVRVELTRDWPDGWQIVVWLLAIITFSATALAIVLL